MENEKQIDYEKYILDNFQYASGIITRTDRKNSNGSLDKYGYKIFKVKGKQFKAHRIAWLLNYGTFPKTELDHINRIKTDNRIENLRESNRKQQALNVDRKPNSNTGVIGVYIDNTKGLKKKYTIKSCGKTYRFYTIEEAVEFKKKIREVENI